MNLYKIEQDVNTAYDTYSDAVVAAESEEEARAMHPENGEPWDDKKEPPIYPYGSWTQKNNVKVVKIGVANEGFRKGVVCASFHAG